MCNCNKIQKNPAELNELIRVAQNLANLENRAYTIYEKAPNSRVYDIVPTEYYNGSLQIKTVTPIKRI